MLARLCISDHPTATWAGAVGPWLQAYGATWRESRAVLAPNSAWVAALKAEAVKAGLPILGLVWLTPGRWRTQALKALPDPARRVALREDLHLLLELAAARLPDNPLAQAYGSDPAPFQELLDLLEGGGWGYDVLPDPAARELAAEVEKLRAKSGWITSTAADRALAEAARAGRLPLMGERLLVVGFGPADWALRSLLEAAAAAYTESEFVLDVLDYNQIAAAAWVGTWEEKLQGSAEWLEASALAAPFAPLAVEIVTPVPSASGGEATISADATPYLWLADNLQAEADLVVAQALAFLYEAGSEPVQVGIVVGSVSSPLAREVAARLAALELPHHDVPGHLPGRVPAQALFEAWLDWQENGRLAGLVSWLRAVSRSNLLDPKTADAIEKAFRKAAEATLSDDPAVMAAWLATPAVSAPEAGAFCAEWPRLPEAANWADFFEVIIAVAQKLQWPPSPETLRQRGDDWRKAFTTPVPRAALLRWVRAVTRVPGRTRDALGRESWAAVQMVDAASAAAQSWPHLILGGLQHGEWPLDERDAPLLEDTTLPNLNRQALRQGSQGEGHWTVAPERGYLLSQADRRRLDRASFARLVGLPSIGLAVTARRLDPADGRASRLSEYFWMVAKTTLGRLPTEADWLALAQISQERREFFRDMFTKNSAKIFRPDKDTAYAPSLAATVHAYNSRRQPDTAFDEYSFCLKTPPAKPLFLSCKNWEEAVARPGAAWFAQVLRVKPRWDPAMEDFTRLSLGIWAHAWMLPYSSHADQSGVPASVQTPSGDLWQKISMDRALEIRTAVAAAFTSAGRSLPESWLDAWANAGRLAAQWISRLADKPEWPQVLAEASLPRDFTCSWPGVASPIPISGRMDLVFSPRAICFAPGQLDGVATWLFDFKTGGAQELTIKSLAKGTGLQLALYARALIALGAGSVALTLLNRDADAEPQLSQADLAAPELDGLWQLLGDFAVAGCWGEKHDLTDEHTRAGEYPAATLPVPGEILQSKWKITHPYFP